MLKLLRRIGYIILFAICVMLIVNLIPPRDSIALNTFMNEEDNLLVATQSGISTDYPANVRASFNTASGFGIMYFSVGVVMTSDEVLIIADYDDLSVYTSESGKISEKTYDEIKNLNFAYNFSNANGEYTYRSSTLTCLTVDEFLGLFPYSNFIINIVQDSEAGERAAVLLCEKLRQQNLSLRVVIKGSENVIKYVRNQTNVRVLTAPIKNEFTGYANADKFFLSEFYIDVPFQYADINIDDINGFTKRLIWSLHRRNVAVFIVGVNTSEQLDTAIELNADGIITNDPVLINELLARQTGSETNEQTQ